MTRRYTTTPTGKRRKVRGNYYKQPLPEGVIKASDYHKRFADHLDTGGVVVVRRFGRFYSVTVVEINKESI